MPYQSTLFLRGRRMGSRTSFVMLSIQMVRWTGTIVCIRVTMLFILSVRLKWWTGCHGTQRQRGGFTVITEIGWFRVRMPVMTHITCPFLWSNAWMSRIVQPGGLRVVLQRVIRRIIQRGARGKGNQRWWCCYSKIGAFGEWYNGAERFGVPQCMFMIQHIAADTDNIYPVILLLTVGCHV